MSAEMLKKLSPKTIMESSIEKPEKAHDLYTVIGIARGVRSGESNYGTWTALTGSFEATRVSDGVTFMGVQAFLPEPMNSMIAERLRADDDVKEVEFAVMVGIKPSDAPIGYEYTAKPLVEVQQADALSSLREKAQAALPAPGKGKGK